MGVAAADATLPAGGIFCSPIAITKIVTTTGAEAAGGVGQLSPGAAPVGRGRGQLHPAGRPERPGDGDDGTRSARPSLSKTGTADNYMSAFFVGYTPRPARRGLGWQPRSADDHTMVGYPRSCYRPWAAWAPCTARRHRVTPGSCTLPGRRCASCWAAATSCHARARQRLAAPSAPGAAAAAEAPELPPRSATGVAVAAAWVAAAMWWRRTVAAAAATRRRHRLGAVGYRSAAQ